MATPSLALPRRWLVALIAVVLAAVTVVVVVLVRDDETVSCGAERVVDPRSPLLDPAQMTKQPDERLDTLKAAVDAMGSPFGAVRAGVGYDYDQWLHVYAVEGGVLAWTKNNAPVTLLDSQTLDPRWSLRPATRRTAWDASANRFLLLDLSAKTPVRVSSYDLADGSLEWCSALAEAQDEGDPVSTAFLADDDVLTALKGAGGMTVTRLSGSTGRERWARTMTGVDRADFLAEVSDGVAIAGGTEEYRLGEPDPRSPGGSVIKAFDVSDGSTLWAWGAGADTLAHVVGISSDSVIAALRSTEGTQLLALSGTDGSVLWRQPLPALAYESTLRGSVVVTRSAVGLDGYDASTGKPLWHRVTPTDVTYFPYGFTLGQMPSLDEDHVLVPTTTALRILDLRTGSDQGFALPIDGVSTTYWPYQLLVTEDLLGLVTNTGAILVDRE